MYFNDVVKYALDFRSKAPYFERRSLDADVSRGEVTVTIYPYNGSYIEKSIGAYKFYLENDQIKTFWMGYL